MPRGKPSPKAASIRAAIAGMTSRGVPDTDPRYAQLRAQLRDQIAYDHIERLLAKAPPLTTEQRTQLAELLAPARESIREQRLTADRAAVVAERLADLK